MAEKISGIYKITNTITGDFYIGSSKNIKSRWESHKWPSKWNKYPNNPMYLDMQKYGVDKFEFQVIEEVEAAKLKEVEQKFIETLKPTYNNYNAKGLDFERRKEYQIEYQKEYMKEYHKQNREKRIEHQIEYYQQNRKKRKEYQNKYNNQLCSYNGEALTLVALSTRFRRAGIAHPTAEAKKYLVL